MKLTETCRCGSSLAIEADGDTAAGFIARRVDQWHGAHRCLDAADDKRSGTGFAAATQAPDLPGAPWSGHAATVIRA